MAKQKTSAFSASSSHAFHQLLCAARNLQTIGDQVPPHHSLYFQSLTLMVVGLPSLIQCPALDVTHQT